MRRYTILALLLALALPGLARAQDNFDERSNQFYRLFEKQVVQSLESNNEQIRTQTLQNVILFATLYKDKVDLRSAVNPIISIYANDRNEDRRVMALAALYAVGNRRAMDFLAERVDTEPSMRVKRMMLSVLNSYYLARADEPIVTE